MNRKASPIKSLPTSLFQREEYPPFGKEGEGEIFRKLGLVNYGLLIKSQLGSDFLDVLCLQLKGEISNRA